MAEYFEPKKVRLQKLRAAMELERSSFDSQARELAQYILPRRARFFTQDANRGNKRYTSIIDSTATMAAFTVGGGMVAGLTSPATPWFKLTVANSQVAERWGVKQWLDDVTDLMRTTMLQSNIYNSFPQIYTDVATFLTSAMLIEPDDEDVIITQVFPWGSYYIAQDARKRVNVFMRRFQMTVRQIVGEFGRPNGPSGEIDWTNISEYTKNQWISGQTELWVEVLHFIMPNEDYRAGALASKYKRFSSCYFENQLGGSHAGNVSNSGGIAQDEKYLRESGYDYFPVLCPRWSIVGEDVYGTDGPGTISIGDAKALQIMHKRKAQAIEKQINPPMNAQGQMKNSKLSVLPGEVNYLTPTSGKDGFVPSYQIQYNIEEMKDEILAHQKRIQRAYHEDTFRMLINDDRPERATAAEIHAKQQEKMLDLGPVLEQLNQDMLDPLIDIVFHIMLQRGRSRQNPFGMIPPPPPEMQNQPLTVEYVSIMAQAQKANALGSYDRFASFVSQVAQVDPSVLDVVNRDKMVEHYGDMCGVKNDVMVDDDKVAAIRQQRAQQQAQQQKMAMLQQATQSAKNLAQAPMDEEEPNALTQLASSAKASSLTRVGA